MPEVICISSSPAQIFARSPTSVLADSPLNSSQSSIPPVSSLLRKPSISRLQRPKKTRNITPAENLTGSFSDNGSVLSEGVGRENLPLSGGGRAKAAEEKNKGTAPKSSKPKPRKRTTKSATTEPTATTTEAGAGGKKPRARKTKVVDKLSNETLTGRVTKSRAGPAPKVSEKSVRASLSPPLEGCPEGSKGSFSWEPGCLDEATSRKLEWTPPKHSPPPVLNLTNDDDDDVLVPNSPTHSRASQGFGELFSTFGYNNPSRVSQDNQQRVSNTGPTKKRRIELVDKSIYGSRVQSPAVEDHVDSDTTLKTAEKAKPVRRRKLTTITAHATAGYMTGNGEEDSALHRYIPDAQADEKAEGKGKRGSKQSGSKPRQSRKKKNSSPEYKILSPEKAFKSFTDQELLFGTLSQLERDESPTLTRDTQLALKNSEVSGASTLSLEGPELSQGNISLCTPSSRVSSTTSRLAGSRNLWSVAARDFDGSLAKADIIDLVDTPKVSEVLARMKPLEKSNDEWLDIDNMPDTPTRDNNISDQDETCVTEDVPVTDPEPIREKDNRPSTASNRDAGAPSLPEKPVFGGYSTAELAKQVASYGFKAIKNRDQMISLLEKCWESKHQNTGSILGTKSQPTAPASNNSKDEGPRLDLDSEKQPASKKTKPVRSKNNAATTSKTQAKKAGSGEQPAEAELPPALKANNQSSNSNKESALSFKETTAPSVPTAPPPSRAVTKPPPSKPSSSTSTTKPPRKSLPDLSLQIKSAIQSQPPLPSSQQPTWHEKILMYDPIVLEDLATWLNTEGLDRVGEDREVSAGFVREWCENEGICCCWKKGLDMPGGSRGAWA